MTLEINFYKKSNPIPICKISNIKYRQNSYTNHLCQVILTNLGKIVGATGRIFNDFNIGFSQSICPQDASNLFYLIILKIKTIDI